MNFANTQVQNNIQQTKPCSPNHVWSGRIPTIDNKNLIGVSCDCGKFILQMEGCRCNGSRKVVYQDNPNYKPVF